MPPGDEHTERRLLPRDELDAALGARRELGEELEPHLVDSFLARVERGLDARVDARVAQRAGRPTGRRPDWSAVVLGVMSLGIAIPITEEASLAGELVAWIAIVVVNVAYNLRR